MYPLSSASAFDLIILINNEFKRIQVKYVKSKDNKITISVRRAIRNGRAKFITNIDFDILAIYCPCTNKCYFINKEEFKESVTLRLTKPKNNQQLSIKMSEDYTII